MQAQKQFYSDPFFHIKKLGGAIIFSASCCFALYQIRPDEFYQFSFSLELLLLLPLAFYIGGLSVVFIHNATHDSFPIKILNPLLGHLSGMHQLWGFTGWKLIHVYHHQYVDHPDRDPHTPLQRTFTEYMKCMYSHPSQVISKRYYEHWGDTPETRTRRKISFTLFLTLLICNLSLWYLLLGPEGMLFFYLPSYIMSYFVFAHLNYYGHQYDSKTGKSEAVNIDEGWYYKFANLFWFGLYYHANHHKKPMLFNPKYMPTAKKVAA